MNLRLISYFLLSAFVLAFSGCSQSENPRSREVVIDKKTGASTDEVVITKADIPVVSEGVSPVKPGGQLGKRILGDKSYVETIIDGLGNRIETRHFPENSRVKMIILRTSAKGIKQATVYGANGETRIVSDLGDNALSASGDEIASIAKLSSERKYTTPQQNFMKGSQSGTQTPLQPLPSSSFQQPVQQNPPPAEPVQPENSGSSETPQTPQTQQSVPDEN